MNLTKPTDFSYHLTNYLSAYLPGQRGVSSNTIRSYRDTFSLFLRFCRDQKSINPEKMTMKTFSKELLEEFLIWLEADRGNSIMTRNQRLSAIHAFFKYLQLEAPEHMFLSGQILAIPVKKHPEKNINYLSFEGIKSILSMPDLFTLSGRRDLTMLSLLYDTGARVSEITDIVVCDVRLDEPATIRLTGKGKKTRIVPLMHRVSDLLRRYITEQDLNALHKRDYPLFSNRMNQKLTRAGITYILDKYVKKARESSPELIPKTVSPHCFRHSKAVHLLQAGVNLIYIRDLLGHCDLKTTEIYAKIDPKMKREALENAYQNPNPNQPPVWIQDKSLMTWLSSLGR